MPVSESGQIRPGQAGQVKKSQFWSALVWSGLESNYNNRPATTKKIEQKGERRTCIVIVAVNGSGDAGATRTRPGLA